MENPEVIRPGRIPPEAFVRFIEDTVDYAMFFLDPDGVVSSWNSGAERMKGYAPEEIIGKHCSAFYPAGDVEDRKPQLELSIAGRQGRHEDEGWRIRKDGTMFWASVTVTAIRTPRGVLQGFATVTRDMTARRHEEDALRRSEERFRLLTNSVKDYAIFMLDPRGHIVSWNEGARRLKGYEASEIIGEHFSRFYTPPDIERDHPANELVLALREGRYEEEGWRIRKDGSRFWASVTITALHDSRGRHVGFAKVTRDLTVRKEAEEQLRQRAQAHASLNRELDAFTHTVAHDLRSPIRAIEHLASVLLEEEAPRLSEDGRITLSAVHRSSLEMARLVQDLLDFSTAAGRRPARERVDLTALARAVADELAGAQSGALVDVRIEEGLAAEADPHLLRIALTNLLGNALKFSRTKPAPRVHVGREKTPEGPAFFVRDNGVGFDPAQAGDIFRPFTRLHPPNEFEGTGIGLATVFRIVDRHGGRVWAEAAPGKGATIYFTLPEVGA